MELLLQLIVSGLALGCIYILETLGFTLIFGVSRILHMAHGAIFLLAAYTSYVVMHRLHFGLLTGLLVATALCGVVGGAIYHWVYRPVLLRGSNPMVLLTASIGILIFFGNLFTAVFGSVGLSLADVTVVRQAYIWGPITIAPMRLVIAAVAFAMLAAALVFLRYTRLGKAMRAIASNPDMAEVVGLSVHRISLWAYVIGSVMTVPAGVLIGLDSGFNPAMGFELVLIAAIVVIVGGMGSLPGAALACLMLGIVQSVAIWKVSVNWQSAIAFGILALFVVLRPQGFFGKKLRKAQV